VLIAIPVGPKTNNASDESSKNQSKPHGNHVAQNPIRIHCVEETAVTASTTTLLKELVSSNNELSSISLDQSPWISHEPIAQSDANYQTTKLLKINALQSSSLMGEVIHKGRCGEQPASFERRESTKTAGCSHQARREDSDAKSCRQVSDEIILD
jgi:hypothetical protein